MEPFTLNILNGNAFNRNDYDVDSMMQLDAKLSAFYMYFYAIDSAKVKVDGKWVPAAVYVSGSHRYIRYKVLSGTQKADCHPQTFYQFPDQEFTTLDFSKKLFDPATDTEKLVLTVDGFEIMCSKSRDFNICLFSMMVSDRFFTNKKSLYTQRTLENMSPYVMDDHARRMGLLLDENRLIAFPVQVMSFIVIDEFSDVLEKGIMNKGEVKLLKQAVNGKMVPCTLGTLRSKPEGCELTMSAASNGYISDYMFQGTDKIVMDHPLLFYLDKNAQLYGNLEKKTLLYKFSAYGRRGIELHFTTEAEYYTMGNLLYRLIDAAGGNPAQASSSTAGGGSVSFSGTLADVEANAKNEEPETDPLEELNALVGLDQLKKDVEELISLVRMQKMRESKGMKAVPVTLHLVFTGNPGTGKTTVARILGKLYKQIGALSKGQLVECDRSGLVAGYIGHTAIQTQKKIDEAMGGILFIDEAYTLAKEGNDFGQEAIDTLLKGMEDHRKDFVVIVAGYPDLMQKFINSNPGLKSRFNKYMYFPDYSADELIKIFGLNCKKYDYVLDDDARAMIEERITTLVENKDENFANAREVRNLFETIITNQASRVDKMEAPTDEELVTITKEDVEKD